MASSFAGLVPSDMHLSALYAKQFVAQVTSTVSERVNELVAEQLIVVHDPIVGPTGPTGTSGSDGHTGQTSTETGPTGPTGPVSSVPGPTGLTGPAQTVNDHTGPTGATGGVAGKSGVLDLSRTMYFFDEFTNAQNLNDPPVIDSGVFTYNGDTNWFLVLQNGLCGSVGPYNSRVWGAVNLDTDSSATDAWVTLYKKRPCIIGSTAGDFVMSARIMLLGGFEPVVSGDAVGLGMNASTTPLQTPQSYCILAKVSSDSIYWQLEVCNGIGGVLDVDSTVTWAPLVDNWTTVTITVNAAYNMIQLYINNTLAASCTDTTYFPFGTQMFPCIGVQSVFGNPNNSVEIYCDYVSTQVNWMPPRVV
jgi:hypothetical protein